MFRNATGSSHVRRNSGDFAYERQAMPIEMSQVRVGSCYRTVDNEMRLVKAVDNDQVSYVVVFHALHRTTVGPIERLPIARFAREAQGIERLP